MTQRFRIKLTSPDGELVQVYEEPRADATAHQVRPTFFVKRPHDGEDEDWIHIENPRNALDTAPRVGWAPSWSIGDPIADKPQVVTARSLTMGAVRNEVEVPQDDPRTISAEYLIALFLIENDLVGDAPAPADDTEFTVTQDRPNPDATGGYGVLTEDWEAFLASEDVPEGWKNRFIRMLVLPQMRCIKFLTLRDWDKFSNASKALLPETELPRSLDPVLPRKLDLLMCRLIGPTAAADVAKREREKTSLNTKMDRVVREAEGWLAGSQPEQNLLRDRAAFLTHNGNAITVKTFLERCRAALDPALEIGFACIKAYLPDFIASPAAGSGKWFDAAKAELAEWSQGWTEHVPPGQERALGYFDHTDHGPGAVASGSGEITHWCGAFVAHCMAVAGAPIPPGSAAAASWAKWGDVSLPTAQDSDIPPGAVVMTSRSGSTNPIGHVTFFVRWEDNRHFIGLGGNQNDRVTESKQRTEKIVAIRGMASKAGASSDDADILARTLWGEINGGRDDQIQNVAHVVLNRFQNGFRSQGSIKGVCLSPQQFSCWNPGTSARRTLEDLHDLHPNQYKSMLKVAKTVIADRLGGAPPRDELVGVHHYYAPKSMRPPGRVPPWARGRTPTLNDDAHLFFRGVP